MPVSSKEQKNLHHVVIVGGGAGGLELATKLGDTLGRRGKAIITLIDKSKTHVWKPLLHEIAAGSMKSNFIRQTTEGMSVAGRSFDSYY